MKALILSNCAVDPGTGSGSLVNCVVEDLQAGGAGPTVVHLPQVGFGGTARGARYLAPVHAVIVALRCLRADRYDLVVCCGGEWGLFSWLANRRPRSWKLLQYSNGVESHAVAAMRAAERVPGFPRPRWYQRGDLSRLHDLAFRYADHVVVQSEFDARYLRGDLGLEPSSITAIETPLPDAFLGRALVERKPRRIGYCGTWQARKNVAFIQRDVEAFLRASPDWRFEAVGPGTTALNWPGAVDPAVAARMRGLGPLPRSRLPEWYEGCSIFLLPSVYESLGLVAAEAMACGCAVIGSPGSAFAASLRHGDEVFLLNSTESPRLSEALVALAQDDALRAHIARGGYRQAQRLSRARWRLEFRELLTRLGTPLPAASATMEKVA